MPPSLNREGLGVGLGCKDVDSRKGNAAEHQRADECSCYPQPASRRVAMYRLEPLPFLLGVRHSDVVLMEHLVELLVCVLFGMQQHPDLLISFHTFLSFASSFLPQRERVEGGS